MTELTVVKETPTLTPGQELVWNAAAVTTLAWVDAGDILDTSHGVEGVDLRPALESAHARLGLALEELKVLSDKLDGLFQATDVVADSVSTLLGKE